MAKDYDIIKKHYGEKFAQYCRVHFPTILEQGEGVLANLIMSLFAPNKSLHDDLINNDLEYEAKSFIQGAYLREKANTDPQPEPHPSVLMQKAGYTLYECNTVADVERFKHFWKPTEALCTFKNIAGRLERCYVFFAVKDNATILKRENFINPRRQDEYGTSVISLQFNKREYNDVSIKNRYNHAVDDPDATFSNDLENIYPGLTDSFAQHYGYNFHPVNKSLQLPGYTIANDGSRYKYNLESDAVYFCGDTIVIKDGEISQLDKFTKILVGNYIFDTQNKTITKFATETREDIERRFSKNTIFDSMSSQEKEIFIQKHLKGAQEDAFTQSFGKIVKMEVVKASTQGNRVIQVTNQNGEQAFVEINKNNDMVSFVNNYVTEVEDDFLAQFKNISHVQMDNMQHCGYNFLYATQALKNVNFPNWKTCKGSCLYSNPQILSFSAPNLGLVGKNFCYSDNALKILPVPSLTKCDDGFFATNTTIEEIDVSDMVYCGDDFLRNNRAIKILTANRMINCGDRFLMQNRVLKVLRAHSMTKCGEYFCALNQDMEKVQLDNLKEYGEYFLNSNPNMKNEILKRYKYAVLFKPGQKGSNSEEHVSF